MNRQGFLLTLGILFSFLLSAQSKKIERNIYFPMGVTSLDLNTVQLFDSLYHNLPGQTHLELNFHQKPEEYLTKTQQQVIEKRRAQVAQEYFIQELCRAENVKIKFNSTAELVIYKPFGHTLNTGVLHESAIPHQEVVINGNFPDVIQTQGDVKIEIPENAFETANNTVADLSEVRLIITEISDQKDFMLSQINTNIGRSNAKSIGIFKISATDKNGKVLRLRPNRSIEFTMPVEIGTLPVGFHPYYGTERSSNVDWETQGEQCMIREYRSGLTENRPKERGRLVLKMKSKFLGWINCAKRVDSNTNSNVVINVNVLDSNLCIRAINKESGVIYTGMRLSNDPKSYMFTNIDRSATLLVISISSNESDKKLGYLQGDTETLNQKQVFLRPSDPDAFVGKLSDLLPFY